MKQRTTYLLEKNLEEGKPIKEEMQKEQDEALRAMDAFMAHNPLKTIRKSIDSRSLVQKQLDQGEALEGAAVFSINVQSA